MDQMLVVSVWSCIMPTSVAYTQYFGASEGAAGWVIGVFAFSGGVCTYPMQLLLERFGQKRTMLFQLIMVAIGLFVYIFSAAWGTIVTLYVGRIISGSVMNNLAIYYVTRASGKNVRSKWMTHISASTSLGYGFGPAVGAIMVAAFKTKTDPNGIIILENKVWNELTAPCWGMLALICILFVVAAIWFEEPPLEKAEVQARKDKKAGIRVSVDELSPTTRAKQTFTKSQLFGISGNIFIFFCFPLVLSIWDVHTINMVQKTWDYSIALASVYISSVFLTLVPIGILMSLYVVPHLSDRKNMMIFFNIAVLATAGFYDYFVAHRADVDDLPRVRTYDAAVYTSMGLIFLTALSTARGGAMGLLTKQVPTKYKVLVNTINLTLYMCGRGIGSYFGDLFRYDGIGINYSGELSPRNVFAIVVTAGTAGMLAIYLCLYRYFEPHPGAS